MDWTYNTIWPEQLPPGEFQNFQYRNTVAGRTTPVPGSYFTIGKFNPTDRCFNNYPAVSTATYLELNLTNVRSFQGISKLGPIKRLELHYATKLESDHGLGELRDDLEWLHINQAKKFAPSDQLLSLRNLKVLCLNSCAPLEDLAFLNAFPELLDFRFVHTDVLDGNLVPLFEHPTLLNTGFINKRRYNRTEKQATAHFEKSAAPEKEWATKGEFTTYRYRRFTRQE